MPRTPAPDDDAALRWDEFNDPSYVESEAAIAVRLTAEAGDADGAAAASGATASVAASSDSVGGQDVDVDADADVDVDAARARDRSAARATLLTGLFAVVYLAYSVGWIIGVGLVPLSGPTLLIEVMYQFSEFLTMIASALWFGAVVALTRGGRAAHRFGWLAIGTLVLIPWPILLGMFS